MDESKEDKVAHLLAEGLDHFGNDEIGLALAAWRGVLAVDPGNAEALDYINTADRRDQRRLPLADQLSDTARRILHEVRAMIERSDWEGALDLLRSNNEAEPPALEYEATIEIMRSRLLRKYAARVGKLEAVPVLRDAGGDLTRYNLPSDAGFVLSLIDGTTRLADLISLSGMDAFEALRIVGHLLDAEILEMRA
jgi:hypothetical protein